MFGAEILIEEHNNILSFIEVVRIMCMGIIDGKEPVLEDFYQAIDFGRNYADKQHHGKEEVILFQYMTKHLGTVADKLIRNGMLVEHDLGRLHMSQLEEALKQYEQHPSTSIKLDIIMNAAAYGDLLARHIEKENEVVFTFAKNNLSKDIWKLVNEETKEFEDRARENGIQEQYLNSLKNLKSKYIIH